MKLIAILGAAGQLGKTLKTLVDNEEYSYKFYSKSDIDITNKKVLEAFFSKQSFDFCVNCAAYTDVEGAEKDIKTAFLVNAEAVKNIAEVCDYKNVKLIHISTDYVFDGNNRKPYKINDKTNPINQYGKSKLKGELYIKNTIKNYYIIRTSWLYSLHGKNFLKTIISKIKTGVNLNITQEEKGTPTSCLELSEFIVYIIKSDKIKFGTYHFSAKGDTTWYGFAKEIGKLLFPKNLPNINPVDSFKTIAKRPKYSVLDISETEKVYENIEDWQISLEKLIINQTLDFKNKNF